MIHEFKNGLWVPGQKQKEGNKPFPSNSSAGIFFNDVSGKSGNVRAAVVDTLTDLMMNMGQLQNTMSSMMIDLWTQLAHDLAQSVPQALQTTPVAEINIKPETAEYKVVRASLQGSLAQQLAYFVSEFMAATGQLSYFREQPWIQDNSHQVQVDVNYVRNRGENFVFHKDNDGNIVFVSLIFDNVKAINATEWTPDFRPIGKYKEEIFKQSWPDVLIEEIKTAKVVSGNRNHNPSIAGGTIGQGAYVAWVDELAWHSSPSNQNRAIYKADQVFSTIALGCAGKLDAIGYDMFIEIMIIIATSQGTMLHASLPSWGLQPGDIDSVTLPQILVGLGLPEKTEFITHFLEDARKIKWETIKIGSVIAESMTYQPTVPGSPQISYKEQTGIGNRPRANSLPENQANLAVPGGEGNQPTRNFIRLWVRVTKTK